MKIFISFVLMFLLLGTLTACSEIPPEEYFFVSLSVSVEELLENMDMLDREKHELVPADGIIFFGAEAIAHEGESVFCVLNREMRGAGIHMVFQELPLFDSVHIQGINNIFEGDAGAMSGWMYRVNGEMPEVGALSFILRPGDFIEWIYTVDFGSFFE